MPINLIVNPYVYFLLHTTPHQFLNGTFLFSDVCSFSFHHLYRYILLIDDIWSAKTWNSIIIPFLPSENDKHSRIIVTTRFHAVGSTCSPRHKNDEATSSPGHGKDLLHKVDFLTGDKPLDLFNASIPDPMKRTDRDNKLSKICG